MRTILGAALLLLVALLAVEAQAPSCACRTHQKGNCNAAGGNSQQCSCTLMIGSNEQPVDCTKLIPKCFLMKRESMPRKDGRRPKPENALLDNDGLYNPECDTNGTFKARQCNNTDTCWCVNSAGVRRTDKGDVNFKCPELVRTYWVIVQMKRNSTDTIDNAAVTTGLRNWITSRYGLPSKYIDNIEYEGDYIYIDLKQNSTTKVPGEVDIADVGYYIEKDVKGDPFMASSEKFEILVNGKSFGVKDPIIMYIDEKPHEISMKRLTAGVIAVIVVVVVAILAGIVVLVLTRRKKGRYEKAEMKEMNEVQRELNS